MEKSKLSKEALEIVKRLAHQVWEKYDDQFGYRTEKQKRNDETPTDNPDNIWFFLGQFDIYNQTELYALVLKESLLEDGDNTATLELLEFLNIQFQLLTDMIQKKQAEFEELSKKVRKVN